MSKRGRVGGKRRRAREMAMQMLYQREMADTPLDDVFANFDLTDYLEESEETPPVTEGTAPSVAAAKVGAGMPPPVTEVPEPTTGRAPQTLRPAPGSGEPAKAAAPGKKASPGALDRRRRLARRSFEYAQRLVRGTLEDAVTIDELIRRHAENWRLERMPPIDRNILRLALYEMLHEQSVPKVVIVDEAIELAKKFGSENSGRFVNGLLDGVLKSELMAGDDRASAPAEAEAGGA